MATEFAKKALESLDQAELQFGDARAEMAKDLASASVYALLDVARAVRSAAN